MNPDDPYAESRVPIRAQFVAVYPVKFSSEGAKFLMLKRNSDYLDKIWQPVTGRIEPGETATAAALRELKEESLLIPDRFYSADFVENFYEPNHNIMHLVPTFVAFIESNQNVVLSNEHGEYKWVDIDSAVQMVAFDSQRRALKHINKYFIESEPGEIMRIKI